MVVLAVDVGNTKTAVAVVQGRALRARRAWATGEATASGVAALIAAGPAPEALAVATVVPREVERWTSIAIGLSLPLCVFRRGDDVPMACDVDDAAGVGVDRLVNALGALDDEPPPLVVVDFGTATTVDCVDRAGRFVGGAILPGAATAMRALAAGTAQLPEVPLVAPPSAIGRNTVHALQSGVVLGYAGGVRSLVQAMSEALGGAVALATGGLAPHLAPHCRCFARIDDTITLRGIARAWELSR